MKIKAEKQNWNQKRYEFMEWELQNSDFWQVITKVVLPVLYYDANL